MWVKFTTCLPGKWVLVGEHTVMRGGMAIVFPFPEVSLRLDFVPQRTKRLKVTPPDAEPVIHELLGIYESWRSGNGGFSWPTGRLTESPRDSWRQFSLSQAATADSSCWR